MKTQDPSSFQTLQSEETYRFANKSEKEILEFFHTAKSGLSQEEAEVRLRKFGKNVLEMEETKWWQIFFRQFSSPFIYLLLAAVVVAVLLQKFFDAVLISLFVAINVSLGFYQEYRSEHALRTLRKYTISRAKVLRKKEEKIIGASELVTGDIVIVEAGDRVPADIRLFDGEFLIIDESVITGESVPVEKKGKTILQEARAITEATNVIFSGTAVVHGRARGVIIASGANSSFGRFAKLTAEIHKESIFAKEMGRLSRFTMRLVLATLGLVFLANAIIKRGEISIGDLLIFSLALAVSVIPEALPVVTTLSLSRGALHLAKRHVVVKRLSAIEDLGSIDVLCTDKTGTLTKNVLTISDLYSQDRENLLLAANLASHQSAEKKLEPFDIALWSAIKHPVRKKAQSVKRLKEIPFDPEVRRNGAVVELEKQTYVILRGGLETILECCEFKKGEREALVSWAKERGREGKRILAVSQKKISQRSSFLKNNHENDKEISSGFHILGLIAFVDPIKETAISAVASAKELGVSLKILTGDSCEVAGVVAREIGLIASPSDVINGEELKNLSSEKFHEAIEKYQVFGRVTPELKHTIIQILQEKHRVGFLGEGINDAPAIKSAGVSLVVDHAADIAREAADIILLKKDLRVIIDGICEGREIFVNTIKYIKATIASNFGNFYAVAFVSLFIDFLPLLPLQILLINLLSDFPMIAISADTVEKREISRPQEYRVKEIFLFSLFLGAVSTIFDFIFFALFRNFSPEVLRTNWFIGSILTELVFLFSVRTRFAFYRARRPATLLLLLSAFAAGMTVFLPYTLLGKNVFSFIPPAGSHIVLIASVVAIYFVCSEVVKLLYYRGFLKSE